LTTWLPEDEKLDFGGSWAMVTVVVRPPLTAA